MLSLFLMQPQERERIMMSRLKNKVKLMLVFDFRQGRFKYLFCRVSCNSTGFRLNITPIMTL